MKRYISLAGALLVGTVLAQEKTAAFTQELAPVEAAVQAAAETPVVTTAKARAVYVSENTTEHDIIDSVETSVEPGVQIVNNDQATSVTSQDEGTSAASQSVNVRVNSATTQNDPETSEGTSADEVQSHEAPTTENDAHTSEQTSNVDNLPVDGEDSYRSDKSQHNNQGVETSVETSANPETTQEDAQEWTSAETSANPETTPAEYDNRDDSVTSHCNQDQQYNDDDVTTENDVETSEATSHDNFQGEEEHWTEQSYHTNYQGEEEHWTEQSKHTDFGGAHAGYYSDNESYHTAYVEEVQSSVTSHDVEDGVTSCDFEEEGIYYKEVNNQTENPVHAKATQKKDHGFVGKCGLKYELVSLGDYFWCDDLQANLRTQCQKVANDQYVCCARDDGCDDVSDLKIWFE